MGRKNFYGSKSINGADVTATLYTKAVSAANLVHLYGGILKIVKGRVYAGVTRELYESSLMSLSPAS